MKKRLVFLLIVILSSILFYLGYNGFKNQKRMTMVDEYIQELPNVDFYNLNGNKENVFKKQGNKLLMYFHPECEHCQYEAKQLVKFKDSIKNTNIYFISPADTAIIHKFMLDYSLRLIDGLEILWDKDLEFEVHFGKSIFPSSFIYNTNNRLVKKYNGEVDFLKILEYLN